MGQELREVEAACRRGHEIFLCRKRQIECCLPEVYHLTDSIIWIGLEWNRVQPGVKVLAELNQ
jgi:hypothetical protein